MSRKLGAALLGTALAAALAAPTGAPAAVTIGSDLAPTPMNGSCTSGPPSCTVGNSALPGATLQSPINGVVVRWRVRANETSPPVFIHLEVLRPGAGGVFSLISRSAIQTFTDTVVTTREYPTNQPIAQGDQIALGVAGTASAMGNFAVEPPISPGVAKIRWEPAMADGETSVPDSVFPSPAAEILVNADIEPDCDADGLGDETQDPDLSPCAAPPDTAAPDTEITKGPKNKTKKRKATFEFTGTDARAVAGFECSLNGPFRPCTSPHTVKVKKGRHTFAVRAVDLAGNVDGSPAADSWKRKKRKKRK